MDIQFFDYEFDKVHILPASSQDIGYVSMNTTTEFNGNGSFELLFFDPELEAVIRGHPEGLLIKWGDFEGFLTDYQFKSNESRIYGMHLNGLLHKEVIPKTDGALQGNVETLAYDKITSNFTWINKAAVKGGFEDITFWRNTYKYGDDFMQDLIARGHAGYRIYLDFTEKKPVFEMLKSEANPLMLSVSNLNAYDIQEDYDNKTVGYGGWYQHEPEGEETEGAWSYIVKDSTKTGLYKQDVILSGKTEGEATNELAEYKPTYEVSLSTKNIAYGVDYKLGDKVRVQKNGDTTTKTVIAINRWHEDMEYNEQPILGELKEVEENE